MFSFFKRKSEEHNEEILPITLPLANIQKIDDTEILYHDNEGNPANIHYFDAYKGWCKSKGIKKSKPKYICDRTKSEVRRLIFYTNPQITFYAELCEEELWFETLNKIAFQGYRSFDLD